MMNGSYEPQTSCIAFMASSIVVAKSGNDAPSSCQSANKVSRSFSSVSNIDASRVFVELTLSEPIAFRIASEARVEGRVVEVVGGLVVPFPLDLFPSNELVIMLPPRFDKQP